MAQGSAADLRVVILDARVGRGQRPAAREPGSTPDRSVHVTTDANQRYGHPDLDRHGRGCPRERAVQGLRILPIIFFQGWLAWRTKTKMAQLSLNRSYAYAYRRTLSASVAGAPPVFQHPAFSF